MTGLEVDGRCEHYRQCEECASARRAARRLQDLKRDAPWLIGILFAIAFADRLDWGPLWFWIVLAVCALAYSWWGFWKATRKDDPDWAERHPVAATIVAFTTVPFAILWLLGMVALIAGLVYGMFWLAARD